MMLTIVAALYVVLPALYALACCALAFVQPTIAEPADEPSTPVVHAAFALAVAECRRKALSCLDMAKAQSTPGARRTWIDASLLYQRRAERYVAAMQGGGI
jgi:hypothetical protein